uniref:FGF1 intracellular binding protein n=1 Tax=Sus scrofa TaxID=9823 RepID=A0A8D0ITM4_PIG
MTSELDIFVGNTTLIDEDVYRLWLDGYSVNDAVALRVRSGILEQTGATAAVLQSDTMDHYRTFHMLERLLHAPPKLLHQLIFQIPPSRQALLIESLTTSSESSRWWRKCGAPWWITSSNTSSCPTGWPGTMQPSSSLPTIALRQERKNCSI